MAADIQHIGAIALLSEYQAASATDQAAPEGLPNPLQTYTERRGLGSFFGAGRDHHRRVTGALAVARTMLDSLPHDIAEEANSAIAPDRSAADVGLNLLRQPAGDTNRETILQGGDIPPYIRSNKDSAAEIAGSPPESYTWDHWLAAATEAQLVNFSQWYTERLRTLATPEGKALMVTNLKERYVSRVHHAMQDGWIDPRLAPMLDKQFDTVDIRFFSPFGKMPEAASGVTQVVGRRSVVTLPTIAGDSVTT